MSNQDDVIIHYGVKRRSGRYPWGSGDNPYQHDPNFEPEFDSPQAFLNRVRELKKQGLSEKEIADSLGEPTTNLRVYEAIAKHEERQNKVAMARQLRDQGLNTSEIGRRMGINESSVRELFNEDTEARKNQAMSAAKFLKEQVAKKGMIDIGKGVEKELGISEQKLREARVILEAEGYEVHGIGVKQATNAGQQTVTAVLCPPGTTYAQAVNNQDKIQSVKDYVSYDGGQSFKKAFEFPSSLDSKRLQIVYEEDGGKDKDGLIELRRGVEDISLGGSNYSQVRIMVDGTHYLKGMAVYSDDLPDGVDVRFNTNKSKDTPALGPKDNTVLKLVKRDKDGNVDADNPFGSLIKEHGGQRYYDDPNGSYVDPVTGNKQSLSLINKRADEGDWDEWSKKLPSQFLSKQPIKLVNKQLDLAKANKEADLDQIMSLTNPVIKKHFLEEFADSCDRTAVHLDAAALPRQRYQVILPMPSLKDNEAYAPNYTNGDKVALIRYPHAGTFEIPIVTINNKAPEGKSMVGTMPKDVVGINAHVAARLSGADFDGDTVMVIPLSKKVDIQSKPPLKDLEGFDPSMAYPKVEGMKKMTKHETQNQMGKISNLISDMTIKGATPDELARAVKHSMVVIDAEKHELNYKLSEKENGIEELKRKYQEHLDEDGKLRYGASTIISRAKSKRDVPERKAGELRVNPETGNTKRYLWDPDTGEKLYTETGREYIKVKLPGEKAWRSAYETKDGIFYKNDDGKSIKADSSVKIDRRKALTETNAMSETNDAFTLVSEYRSPVELAYADYANKMKSLANRARKEISATKNTEYNPSAKKVYANEVAHLTAQINEAEKNKPRERQAQILANTRIAEKERMYPDMTKAELKKIKQQELVRARIQVGAHRKEIHITDREWEAIQAGAVTTNILSKLMDYANPDDLRNRAMPKEESAPSKAVVNRMKSLANSGYTMSEIAATLNLPATTIRYYLTDEDSNE